MEPDQPHTRETGGRGSAAPRHLAQVVVELAAREPERRLFTFLYAEREEQNITAGDLHRDAGRVAGLLRDARVRPRDILPLVFDHGYDLVAAFWGAIYLGAVPSILPYLSREAQSQAYLDQVARLTRFVRAPAVATAGPMVGYLRQGLDGDTRIIALPPCPIDGSGPPELEPATEPTDPPYIQFSSGTTGLPKGVILSHAALLRYCRAVSEGFATTSGDVTVGWLPLYHDMGLLSQIFETLLTSRHSVLMNPAAWLREPQLLFQAIDRFRGNVVWMPNFAYRYCTRRIRDEQMSGIDLSSWRIAGSSSEPVMREDLEAFADRFAAYGFKRQALTVAYGMAEHVAGVSWTPHDRFPEVDWVSAAALDEGVAATAPPHDPSSRAIVSCGYPVSGVAVRLIDGAGRARGERELGEILVRSPMLFKGYYGMPEETAETLADGWLHTGDIGYLADGQLYVCGRKKDLIIVGGRNLHPNYIEALALAVLGERGRVVAAFGVVNEHLGTEVPVVVCELRQLPDEATRAVLQRQVREQIRQSLQLFVADVHLVEAGWIVRTTSGKINRAANRQKYLVGRARAGANADTRVSSGRKPADASEAEGKLMAIWRGLFPGLDVGLDDDFFALGGDSLLAAQLALEIEEEFQRVLPAAALVEAPTIAALARILEQPEHIAATQTLVPLQPAGERSRRPPFFCVHGVGGGVLDYRPLSRALGDEQPFYGLQARGRESGSIDDSIEAMAAHYIETIKTIQPRGPYHLGGYCYGGIVAFEMARQLVAAADEVAVVAIMEGYAPLQRNRRDGIGREWLVALNFVRALPYWLRDYLQLGRMRRQARNRRLLRVVQRRLLRLLGQRNPLEVADLLDDATSHPAQIQKVLETHLAAAYRYAPTPCDGRLVLFRTPHRLLEAPEPDMGWSKLSTHPVGVELIAGSHGTILQEPHVRVLAERLAKFLSAAA